MTWPPGRQSWSEAQPWTPSPHSDPGTRWGLLYYIWNVLSWGSLSFRRLFFKLLFPFLGPREGPLELLLMSVPPPVSSLNHLYCLINHQRNHQPSPCDPLNVLLDHLGPPTRLPWPRRRLSEWPFYKTRFEGTWPSTASWLLNWQWKSNTLKPGFAKRQFRNVFFGTLCIPGTQSLLQQEEVPKDPCELKLQHTLDPQ